MWEPRHPPRARVVVSIGLVLLSAFFIAGARVAFNKGETGDFQTYFHAAVAAAAGDSPEHYGHVPPLLFALMRPLTLLSQAAASRVWVGLTFLLFAATFWVGARDVARRWRLRGDALTAAVLVLGAAFLTWGPIRAVLRNGQMDGLVLAGFVFGLTFLDRRPALAGFSIAFAAHIKYTPLIVLPYLLLRRRFAAAAWTVVFLLALAFLPAAIIGWDVNRDSLGVALAGLLRIFGIDTGAAHAAALPAIDYDRSVSITSAIARLALPRLSYRAMYAIVLATAAIVFGIGWAMYRRAGVPLWSRPRPDTADAPAITSLEWCALIVGVLLFSPQTQVRQMVALGLPHLVAAALIMRNPRRSGWLIAGLAIEQAGLHLPPGSLISDETSTLWRATGWPCWCLLVFFLILLRAGLAASRDLVQGDAVPDRPDRPRTAG